MKKLFIILCFLSIPAFAAVTVSNLTATKNLDAGGNPISVVVTITMTDSVTGRTETRTGVFVASQFANAAAAKAAIEAWGKLCVSGFKADNAKRAAAIAASTQAVSTATVDTTAIESAP